jgi:hypothetical protein
MRSEVVSFQFFKVILLEPYICQIKCRRSRTDYVKKWKAEQSGYPLQVQHGWSKADTPGKRKVRRSKLGPIVRK